jgi:hypothetical protein
MDPTLTVKIDLISPIMGQTDKPSGLPWEEPYIKCCVPVKSIKPT